MDFISMIDFTGTFVFAVSGVIAGVDRKFDLLGVFILGFVTALGGGTLRDLLIGSTPVGWMKSDVYIYIVVSALPIVYIWKDRILKMKKGIFLFDTIGIGLFTVLGIQKTLALGLSPLVAILMGVVSAVFGGIIRDVLSNHAPLIFSKEIYATACFIGAIFYISTMAYLPENMSISLSIGIVILIRILSIKMRWSLPFNP